MKQDSRTNYILKEIDAHGIVTIVDLAKALDVSEMTIRRDLVALEQEGVIRRIPGGAVNLRGRNYEQPLYLRSEENKGIKKILGKYAAEMVADGDTISLDVGSTIYEIALNLKGYKNLTVITPSLHIANLLIQEPGIRVIIPGGVIRHLEASIVGEVARSSIEKLFVDRLFLGVGGLDAGVGLTEFDIDDTYIKQALIKNAKEVVVVADSSKFQKIAFSLIGPFSAVHRLVCNEMPTEPLYSALVSAGVAINVATSAKNDRN